MPVHLLQLHRAVSQGRTLVHVSDQRKYLLWDTLGGLSVSVTGQRLRLNSKVDECNPLPFMRLDPLVMLSSVHGSPPEGEPRRRVVENEHPTEIGA